MSDVFWGTVNDKTIARHDPVFDAFRDNDGYLANVEWHTVKSNSSRVTHRGLYMICDGGYHYWVVCMNPFKHQNPGSMEEQWSQLIESVRKDVECTCGILKKRFLILKFPIRLHDADQIRNPFVTCCVLHNLILRYDGNDSTGKYNFMMIYILSNSISRSPKFLSSRT